MLKPRSILLLILGLCAGVQTCRSQEAWQAYAAAYKAAVDDKFGTLDPDFEHMRSRYNDKFVDAQYYAYNAKNADTGERPWKHWHKGRVAVLLERTGKETDLHVYAILPPEFQSGPAVLVLPLKTGKLIFRISSFEAQVRVNDSGTPEDKRVFVYARKTLDRKWDGKVIVGKRDETPAALWHIFDDLYFSRPCGPEVDKYGYEYKFIDGIDELSRNYPQ